MKKCSLSLNFDSMNEALGFPEPNGNQFFDSSFFEVADRLFDALGEKIRISIFIIGKDLENPEIRDRVRDWASRGHEIGNHTYSHPQDFGCYNHEKLKNEILKSHEIIFNVTSIEPKGFIAPGWSMPDKGYEILSELNYKYDLSCFNSIWVYPLTAKLVLNELKCGEVANIFRTLKRSDYVSCLRSKGKYYFLDKHGDNCNHHSEGGLLVIPMPKLKWNSLPIWHTAGFFMGFESVLKSLNKFYLKNDYLYYTMHPADFFEKDDFCWGDISTHLERMQVPLNEKLKNMESTINFLKENCEFITIEQYADSIISESKE